eukprot:1682043-Prymnesium_polylepis.1
MLCFRPNVHGLCLKILAETAVRAKSEVKHVSKRATKAGVNEDLHAQGPQAHCAKRYPCGNMGRGVWTSAYDKDSIPCPQVA